MARTYHHLRSHIVQTLGRVMDPVEAAAEARLWLQWGLGIPGDWLAQHGGAGVTTGDARRIARWLGRRIQGEPLAQILGWAPFCGRRFRVTRDVMIPRPHSEAAARMALAWGRELGVRTCLDVGTGCGNLAITLALDSDWHVDATELSPLALRVARANAKRLGAQVGFRLGSLLDGWEQAPAFIVANLPYVDVAQVSDMAQDLAFEPQVALVSPGRGTDLNRALLVQAREKRAHACLLELGPGQGAELTEVARAAGWTHVHVSQDSLGHDHLLRVW